MVGFVEAAPAIVSEALFFNKQREKSTTLKE
jgi:hypothetical protein